MQKTPYYDFNLPDPNDPSQIADVSKISENFSALDTILKAFQDGQFVAAAVVDGDLILTKADGSTVNAGRTQGRGIASAEVTSAGFLMITYDTGESETVGRVKGDKGDRGATGATGAPGADGQDGRGIARVYVANEDSDFPGDLFIVYTDGSEVNVGHVVGADGAPGVDGEPGDPGVGISSAAINASGHLIVTLDDSTSIDAGLAKAVTTDPSSPPTAIGDMLILGKFVFVGVNDGGLRWEPFFDKATLSFADIQALVRYGVAPLVYKPHVDTISVTKGNSTLIFDVLGHDIDTPSDNTKTHSMAIASRNCVLDAKAFGEPEALFYFENGLAAGTYNFTVKKNQWYASDVNKTFEFTLTEDVPAGGQLVSTRAATAGFAGTSIKSYASGSSTTVIETATVTEGSSGTSLGNVGETLTATNNLIYRSALFNNEYRTSPLRQLINSTAAAGSVWSPAGSFDRPPTWASTTDGWLKDVDAAFVSVLGNVKKKTMLPAANGNTLLETDEKVFLLSCTEIFGGNEISGSAEGSAYPYFSQFSDLSAAGVSADSNRVKQYSGTAKTWWLRTARVENPYVYSTLFGKVNGGITYSFNAETRAVVVACCIV